MTGRLTLTKAEIQTAIRQYLERIGLTFAADSLPDFEVTQRDHSFQPKEFRFATSDRDLEMACVVDVDSAKKD